MSSSTIQSAENSALQSAAQFPQWFVAAGQSAQQQHELAPLPARTDESWRFGDLSAPKELLSYQNASKAQSASSAASLLEQSPRLSSENGRVVFANDVLLALEIPESWSELGIIVADLASACNEHAELIERHLLQQRVRLGSEKFAAWHRAALCQGVFVYVPEGVQVPASLEITHWIEGEEIVSFPHTLVVAQRDSKLSIYEQYRSVDSGKHAMVSTVDLVAESNAQLVHSLAQRLNKASKLIEFQTLVSQAGAQLTALHLQLGCAWSRLQSYSRMCGRDAKANMLAAVLADGRQSFDARTLQVHESEGASSDLLFKNVLFDESKNVFSGLIVVEPGAHQTDAYQSCRNLLNDERVEAHSLPGLEIHADQVACSHGSTSGQMDEEQLFYLRARGISKAGAQHLISRGFLVEVLERLPEQSFREPLTALIEDALVQIGR